MTAASIWQARPATTGGSGLLLPVLQTAAIAAGAELLVQRLLVRIGVHVPALPALREPYSLVSTSGSIIFPGAVLVTLLALIVVVARLRTVLPPGAWPVLAATTWAFPIAGLYAALTQEHTGLETPLVLLYALAVIPAGMALAVSSTGRRRLSALMITLALVLAAATSWAPLNQSGSGTAAGSIAEALFLVFLVSAPLALTTPAGFSRRTALLSGLVGLVILLSQIASGSTTNILFLWSLGLTGGLPFLLYAAAAAGFTYAVLVEARRGLPVLALGLLLVGFGGIGLHNTYQSTLQILGLCVLLLAVVDAPAQQSLRALTRRRATEDDAQPGRPAAQVAG